MRAHNPRSGRESFGTAQPWCRRAFELERSAFVSALWTLPARQREVVVLRYFADLPETQIASATGISEATVRSHTAQALSSLRAELGGDE